MAIVKDLSDQLLAGRVPQDLFAKDGLVDERKKALSQRLLNAELDEHLAGDAGRVAGNHRNGTSKVTPDIRRDRDGSFDPKLVAKSQRRFPEFDDKVISMYARGMSLREIRMHLEDIYGIDVSPDLISAVTTAVLEVVAEWQNRPLVACHPQVLLDAIRVKIRNKAVYIALGILPDGTKDIPGLWIEQTEGAKFWLRVMNALKARGFGDILVAVVDGLKGFPEAINVVVPDTVVQTCIVHLIRHSMNFASWKDRKPVAQALRAVYRAKDAEEAAIALDAFEEGPWGAKYPAIGPAWRWNWDMVIPFFAFPESVCRIIYTMNAIEALNSKLRRAVRARGHPNRKPSRSRRDLVPMMPCSGPSLTSIKHAYVMGRSELHRTSMMLAASALTRTDACTQGPTPKDTAGRNNPIIEVQSLGMRTKREYTAVSQGIRSRPHVRGTLHHIEFHLPDRRCASRGIRGKGGGTGV